LGAKRALDYIGAADILNVTSAEASDLLDLGSDHRAVIACISIPKEAGPRHVPKKKLHVDWRLFEERAKLCPDISGAAALESLEERLGLLAGECSKKEEVSQDKAWDSSELQDLRDKRRTAAGMERTQLSKLIWRKTRQRLRTWKTNRASERPAEFSRIKDLERIHMHPVSRKCLQRPNLARCADLWDGIYAAEHGHG